MKTIKIGSIGLGRLGYEHAKNIATRVPGAELAAICDVDAKRVAEVAAELGVPNTYTDVAEMCANPELDAIVVVSPSMYHAEHIKIALDAGKHVFCDKPLDTTVEKCLEAEKAVEAHPDKVFMLGFMRRFDDSYADAKRRIDNGDIGKVVLVRSYTQDPRATIEGTLKFAPHSGGQFLDMCVHDIDLIRWFTGSNVKKVWGLGGVFEFDLYRELNDADNAAATVQCENGAMGFMFTNRTHGAGCNVETEIIGTHGTLRIANVGAKNLLQIVDGNGAHEQYYPDFLSRWHEAYVNELAEFVSCIREGRKPEVTVYDGTAVSRTAYRCKESFETGEMLDME
ncbi:Gfo/Idh/MocA family oxidoreductase [Intestinibacillus massiliensis]|uniref:Gfo/Idh/MocA family oxidoreductase n=1 Tax=Intestinibacillus massiliensis TaxID=1871029 RepID=UPI000B35D8E0|nr:Gfo/Idh/MocA family oxidoreductase [Intestinibacillus massiliensis]MCB6365074.1 Gfo/Idh/MocA family oxidoreductase [Intestinibacillus massiliensis]